VPLPLDREAAARALGFAGLDHNVAAVQNARGKLEADALFWCVQLGHELAKLSGDVILYSGEEFALLRLPARLATGSSIMPHKRNPDLFELTRARVAAIEGDLAAVLAIRSKLTSGYHRDVQLLKEPLMRGLGRTQSVLAMLAIAIPQLEVDRVRGLEALSGGALATDEVMRRVDTGVPFRRAYRDVAAALKRGETFPSPSARTVMARRRSAGGVGRLGLEKAWRRFERARQWSERERRSFHAAMDRLVGRGRR
jgi:argininosuccinate lyase